jgi:DNA-binding transcriptional MerR regulator
MHDEIQTVLPILTPREAAEYARVSVRQVRRWREIGLIEPIVSRWRPRYRREDLDVALEFLGRSGR